MSKTVLFFSLVLLLSPLAAYTQQAATGKAHSQGVTNVYVFSVKGIETASEAAKLEAIVTGIQGVGSCVVNLKKQTCTVKSAYADQSGILTERMRCARKEIGRPLTIELVKGPGAIH